MLSFWGVLISGLAVFAGSGLALGAALGLTGLVILQFLVHGSTYVALDAVWNVLNSFTLSAIPLFIILGEIMLRSGVSQKIYAALMPLFQMIPGDYCTPTSQFARYLAQSVDRAYPLRRLLGQWPIQR